MVCDDVMGRVLHIYISFCLFYVRPSNDVTHSDIIYLHTELVSNGELTRMLNDGVIPSSNWLARLKIAYEV